MPIAAIFLHSFYIVVSCLEGGIVALYHGPTFADPLQKSKTDSKKKFDFFIDYYVFGTKNRQNRGKFKVKTFVRNYYVFETKN